MELPSGCKGETLLISIPSLLYTSSFNPAIKLVPRSFCIVDGKPTLVNTPIKASQASFAVSVRKRISSGHLLKLQITHITHLKPLDDVGIIGPTKSTDICEKASTGCLTTFIFTLSVCKILDLF